MIYKLIYIFVYYVLFYDDLFCSRQQFLNNFVIFFVVGLRFIEIMFIIMVIITFLGGLFMVLDDGGRIKRILFFFIVFFVWEIQNLVCFFWLYFWFFLFINQFMLQKMLFFFLYLYKGVYRDFIVFGFRKFGLIVLFWLIVEFLVLFCLDEELGI